MPCQGAFFMCRNAETCAREAFPKEEVTHLHTCASCAKSGHWGKCRATLTAQAYDKPIFQKLHQCGYCKKKEEEQQKWEREQRSKILKRDEQKTIALEAACKKNAKMRAQDAERGRSEKVDQHPKATKNAGKRPLPTKKPSWPNAMAASLGYGKVLASTDKNKISPTVSRQSSPSITTTHTFPNSMAVSLGYLPNPIPTAQNGGSRTVSRQGSPAPTCDPKWPNKMAMSMGLVPKPTTTGKGKATQRGSRQSTPIGQTRAAMHKKEHDKKKATARRRKGSGGVVIK